MKLRVEWNRTPGCPPRNTLHCALSGADWLSCVKCLWGLSGSCCNPLGAVGSIAMCRARLPAQTATATARFTPAPR